MLPAKNVCPSGWNLEYHGYIMSASRGAGESDVVNLYPNTLINIERYGANINIIGS